MGWSVRWAWWFRCMGGEGNAVVVVLGRLYEGRCYVCLAWVVEWDCPNLEVKQKVVMKVGCIWCHRAMEISSQVDVTGNNDFVGREVSMATVYHGVGRCLASSRDQSKQRKGRSGGWLMSDRVGSGLYNGAEADGVTRDNDEGEGVCVACAKYYGRVESQVVSIPVSRQGERMPLVSIFQGGLESVIGLENA
ncbi:hypothetical protein Tco_0990587 [Tanacetum coccineum]|uniref:Uncharacterized protein n=1 Tax=Tanacetum coccineum TaxID=301880 RepID=A0ABQ5EXP7_9ASTR